MANLGINRIGLCRRQV